MRMIINGNRFRLEHNMVIEKKYSGWRNDAKR